MRAVSSGDPNDAAASPRNSMVPFSLRGHVGERAGLTLWGFTDKIPWITDYPESFSGYGAATPLDAAYRRKPAWTGIADALK